MIRDSEKTHVRPGPTISFVIAVLFLALALWAATGAGYWALGLLALAIVWVFLGIRALRRTRTRV